jgi:hypothetical protein
MTILKKTFYISAADFSVQKQEITQTAEGRMIQVNYSMMKYKETTLPGNVVINNVSAQRKISN